MIDTIEQLISNPLAQGLAVSALLVRVLCIAAENNKQKWRRHALRFVGFAAGYGAIAVGAVCYFWFDWPYGPALMLYGIVALVFSEWRLSPPVRHDKAHS